MNLTNINSASKCILINHYGTYVIPSTSIKFFKFCAGLNVINADLHKGFYTCNEMCFSEKYRMSK